MGVVDRSKNCARCDRAVLSGASGLGVLASSVMFFTQAPLPFPLVVVLMFCMGAATPFSVTLTTVRKRNDPSIASIATALVNTSFQIAGAVGQQLFGVIIHALDGKNNKDILINNSTVRFDAY